MTSLPQPDDTPDDRPGLHLVTDLPDEAVTSAPQPDVTEDEDWVSDPAQLAEVIRTPSVVQVTTRTVIPAYVPPPLHKQVMLPVSRWATAFTVAGQLLLAGAARLNPGGDPVIIVTAIIAWTICGLLVICAEMVPRVLKNQRIERARQAQAIAADR